MKVAIKNEASGTRELFGVILVALLRNCGVGRLGTMDLRVAE